MYSNIGSKIKRLAQVIAIIGFVIFVVVGIIIMAAGPRGSFFSGLFTIIVGGVLSWISSFFVYGFGQLIENTDKMVGNVPAGRPAANPQRPPQPRQATVNPQGRPQPQPQQNIANPQMRPQPQPQQNVSNPQANEQPQTYTQDNVEDIK